jgi:Ser/Thr protein kinase RdoA (MazF antagonist)
MSIGQMEVVRAIQRDDLACRALGALGANYRGTALVHGDFRWDNILVQGTTRSRISRLHLIDWELAGSGDAAWDVGTSFASFLGRCLRFMDPGENVTSSTLRSAFIRRLPSSQIEMGAFWREFARTAHLDSALRRAVLVRATNYCGAKLLQTAYEWSPANTVSPIAACYLQLGLNMLRSPQEATLRVLGIDPRAN